MPEDLYERDETLWAPGTVALEDGTCVSILASEAQIDTNSRDVQSIAQETSSSYFPRPRSIRTIP